MLKRIGCLAALVGAVAGMLIVIRWDSREWLANGEPDPDSYGWDAGWPYG